jgi:heme exporter protein B
MINSSQHALKTLLWRDFTLAARNKSEWLNPLLFFVFAAVLFPLGIGPDTVILKQIAPGIIWVVALLAALLSLDTIFRADFEDGSLEQLTLSPYPFAMLVLGKIVAHWLLTGLPLILLSPLLATFFHLEFAATLILMQTLLLGTPVLSLVGAIGSALTVGLKRGSMLISLLVLPLYVPVLIFGANAVAASTAGLDISGHLMLIAALLALALTLAPLATAAALRASIG